MNILHQIFRCPSALLRLHKSIAFLEARIDWLEARLAPNLIVVKENPCITG